MKGIFKYFNSLGLKPEDSGLTIISKNILVYLALLMSIGGIVWGGLSLFFGLYIQSLIPFGYIIISAVNLFYFAKVKNYEISVFIQILASMFLPFMLQWSLGGYSASGLVLLWSILALIGSVVLIGGKLSYNFLAYFVILVMLSVYFEPQVSLIRPTILTPEVSRILLAINFTLVISIFFILTKLKFDLDVKVQKDLQNLNEFKNKSLEIEKDISKRLEISERRYRNLVEESRVFICTHNTDGIITTVNKPGAVMLGYEQSELIDNNISLFIPEEYKNDYEFYLEYIQKHGMFESFMTVITKKGERRVLLFRNVLIEEEDQKPYVLGSAQDVTEWRKSEFRENQIKKDLELIISSMDDFVVEFDEKGCFKNLICRDESLLFMPVASFIGKSIKEVFTHAPEFADEAQRLYDEAIETREPRVIQIEDIFSETPIFYSARLNPLIEEDGTCTRCTGLVTNITHQKIAENELNEAFNMQSVIIESLEGGVLVVNDTGKIQLVNQELCSLLMIEDSPHDLYGISSLEFIDGRKKLFLKPQEFIDRLRKVLDNKERVLNEEVVMANGRVLERDFIPIYLDEDYKGHMWHYQDISKRKEFEQALRGSKEEAEKANKLKTIFMGNLSHEVRTPLQGIQGFTEILENPALPDNKRSEYLKIIKSRTADLQHIIDSLLDMASLETGEIKSFPQRVDIVKLLQNICKDIGQAHSMEMSDKSIDYKLDLDLPGESFAHVDPQHFKQVLTNLVRNAIKFTDAGEVSICAFLDQSEYHIKVKDTGIGIPGESLIHIFEPFRQAHEGLSRSKGGIGLGLSICKKMVELWGGCISVSSELEKGSCFTISIPVVV